MKSVLASANSVVMGGTTSASYDTIGEPVPGAIGGIDSARMSSRQQLLFQPRTRATCSSTLQDIQRLKEQHRWEKTELTTQIKQLKKNLRALKVTNTRLQRSLDARMQAEEDHRKVLQELEVTNNKLQEEHLAEMQITELTHRREKKILVQRNKLLKNDLRSLKMSNSRLKRNLDTKEKTQEELQKKMQAVKVANNKLQEEHAEMQVTELSHRRENQILVQRNKLLKNDLRSLKMSITKLKRNLDKKEKTEDALREELQAVKSRVAANNMQLAGNCSAPQCHQCGKQQIQRGGIGDVAEVSVNGYDLIRILGEGSYGTVVLAKRKVLGEREELYAIKAIRKNNFSMFSEMCQTIAEKEALILASPHPFIVNLHSCFQNEANLFLVMDYVSGGDLFKQLQELGTFSERRTQFYAAEIILALQFLHKHGIVHRDIKLENVLVGSDGHCKVSDLGLAKLGLFNGGTTNTLCGTPQYMAPEILLGSPYGKAVDWWALGIMIYEMLTGYLPFCSDNREQLNYNIVTGKVHYPRSMSPAAVSLVTKLLVKDPKKRLGAGRSIDTIRKHPFFKGLDWVALQEKRVEPPEKPVNIPQETEGHNRKFSKLLKRSKKPKRINPHQFSGFSYINHAG